MGVQRAGIGGEFGGGSFARLASDADPEQLRVGRTGTSTNRSGPCRGRGNPAELSGGTTRQRRDNLAVASALLVRSPLLKARRMPKQDWQLPQVPNLIKIAGCVRRLRDKCESIGLLDL